MHLFNSCIRSSCIRKITTLALIVGTMVCGSPGLAQSRKRAETRSSKGQGSQKPDENNYVIAGKPGVVTGHALYRAEPTYPAEAVAAGVSGKVEVEITIDEDGMVIAANALEGNPLLVDAAVKAAKEWIFEPSTIRGVPVKVIGSITFNFENESFRDGGFIAAKEPPAGMKRTALKAAPWVDFHPGNCALSLKLPAQPSMCVPSKGLKGEAAAKREAKLAARGLKDYRMITVIKDLRNSMTEMCYGRTDGPVDARAFAEQFVTDFNDKGSLLWSGPGLDVQSDFDYDGGPQLKCKIEAAPGPGSMYRLTGELSSAGEEPMQARGVALSQGNRAWVIMVEYDGNDAGFEESALVLDSVKLSDRKCVDEALSAKPVMGELSVLGQFFDVMGAGDSLEAIPPETSKLDEVVPTRGADGQVRQITYRFRLTEELMRHATKTVQAAYQAHQGGKIPDKVLVKVWIDESGNVVGARGLAADVELQQGAEKAARGWKFRGSKPIPACSVGLIEVSVEKKSDV